MRTRLFGALAAILIVNIVGGASAHASPQQAGAAKSSAAQRPSSPEAGGVASRLVGRWNSAPYRTPLSGAFEESVWGPNASSVRTVELDIRPSGQSVLTVTTRVMDAKGRVVRGSTAVEEAQLLVGAAGEPSVAGTEHAVKVVGAERRYPDDPASKWPLEGLRVRVLTRDGSADLEIRYDTPEGRGSFWETLVREAKKGRSTGA